MEFCSLGAFCMHAGRSVREDMVSFDENHNIVAARHEEENKAKAEGERGFTLLGVYANI